ncbi:hypothetical protein PR048_013827 [Dryococelus australis]|uniref:HTH CENPB-type domain-containing protein n=1 Tax=Dryococelus australis TaxID=614101 RepID=A0ABQ9HT91_9NEOP|nr:hypothetical protein PR048_013827 [Dryococelus australis]
MKKYEIIMEVDKQKTPKSEIARQHGIPKSTLFTILKMREERVNAVKKEGSNVQLKNLQRMTHGYLEEALLEWFGQVRAQNLPVSGPMVQKADELALRLGIDDLKCSSGWLDSFKVHHRISCHKIVGEIVSVDPQSVSEWLPLLQNILSRYQPRGVYNADELGIFYNLMPDRTLAVKGDVCKGTKSSKKRLTVLLCCNMDSSDMKSLVICKLKNPEASGRTFFHVSTTLTRRHG